MATLTGTRHGALGLQRGPESIEVFPWSAFASDTAPPSPLFGPVVASGVLASWSVPSRSLPLKEPHAAITATLKKETHRRLVISDPG